MQMLLKTVTTGSSWTCQAQEPDPGQWRRHQSTEPRPDTPIHLELVTQGVCLVLVS